MSTGPPLHERIQRCLDKRPAVLVLDLTAVTFLGSTGLSIRVDAHQSATPHTVLRVVAGHHAVLRPIQLTGLDHFLTVDASVERALALSGRCPGSRR